jgi:hypothetical protein
VLADVDEEAERDATDEIIDETSNPNSNHELLVAGKARRTT